MSMFLFVFLAVGSGWASDYGSLDSEIFACSLDAEPEAARAPAAEMDFMGLTDCDALKIHATPAFRQGMLHLKKKLHELGLDPNVFPVLFAQLANESGFGHSKAARGYNNLGGRMKAGESSGFRSYRSMADFIDDQIEYLNGAVFGECLERPTVAMSKFSRSKKYIRCILSGADSWRTCMKNHSRTRKPCYCASGCSPLYDFPKFASEKNIPDYREDFGLWRNYKIGVTLLEDPHHCGLSSKSVSVPKKLATAAPASASFDPRLLSPSESRRGPAPGCEVGQSSPPVGEACSPPGHRVKYCHDRYSCYCQYDASRKLIYNCYDVGGG